MRHLIVPALFVLAAPAVAQANYLHMPASSAPATSELNRYSFVPFMQPNAKVQCFYSAAEAGSTAFAVTELALRYDGPTPKVGVPGPFAIQRLRIEIGASSVATPGAVFAANLSQPLTKAFEQEISFMPDSGSATPDVWGGTNDTLRFPLASPVPIVIPPGGFFVLQLSLEGNANKGLSHAVLDAQRFSGITDGTSGGSGVGCSDGFGNAFILTDGLYAPGAAHSIYGSNLGRNAPVSTMVGASDASWLGLALPFTLPGTSCTAYCSYELALPQAADATGAILAQSASSFLSVPPDAGFSGAVLFEQHVSYVPGANAYGLVFSNKRTVQLGSYAPPTNGVWFVANGDSATAPAATLADALGIALRVKTS